MFLVQAISKISKVAAGMSVYYKIFFETKTYQDVEDFILFQTYAGQIIQVKLKCTRQPPALQVFICKEVDHFLNKVETSSSCENLFDDRRASALNYTFDCGLCLLGEKNTMSMLMRNEGGKGTFFIMTEDEWYFGDVKVSDNTKKKNILTVFIFF